MEEIWKDIPQYSGLYEASNLGRIRSKEGKITSSARYDKRVWKQRIMKQKYKVTKGRKDAMVTLWKNRKPYYHLVSRLVASAFHEDLLLSKMTVNHIDGNPLNNCSDNLEWVTRGENVRLGFENGQYSSFMKPIVLICENGKVIKARSKSMACEMLGRSKSYIHDRLSRKKEYAYSKDGERYRIISDMEVQDAYRY